MVWIRRKSRPRPPPARCHAVCFQEMPCVKMLSVRHSAQYPPSPSWITSKTISSTHESYDGRCAQSNQARKLSTNDAERRSLEPCNALKVQRKATELLSPRSEGTRNVLEARRERNWRRWRDTFRTWLIEEKFDPHPRNFVLLPSVIALIIVARVAKQHQPRKRRRPGLTCGAASLSIP